MKRLIVITCLLCSLVGCSGLKSPGAGDRLGSLLKYNENADAGVKTYYDRRVYIDDTARGEVIHSASR